MADAFWSVDRVGPWAIVLRVVSCAGVPVAAELRVFPYDEKRARDGAWSEDPMRVPRRGLRARDVRKMVSLGRLLEAVRDRFPRPASPAGGAAARETWPFARIVNLMRKKEEATVGRQRGQHQCAGAKCPIAKRSSGRDARPSRALLPTCWNFRSSNLGTISAREAERGVRSSLGTGDVSNAQNSIHAAKRSGVEFPQPPPSAGRCRLRWCASASGGLR
jgi:hypothetical protein